MIPNWRLLALPPLERSLLEALFADLAVDVVVPESRDRKTVLELVNDVDIVLGDWSGGLGLDSDVVAAAARLAFVQQPSVGVDTIDVDACTAAGVPVANAGDTNAVSVAEWCVGATFTALRSMPYADAQVRAGNWPQLQLSARGGGELANKRVGILGMGRIAREAAKRYVALGCDVAHHSRTPREPDEAGGARWLPLDDLLAHSDVLVVLVALAPQTRGLIGAEQLRLLPPGAFVVNAARGGIVDETALLAAIDDGGLAGAALDVYATEPLPAESPLRDNDRIVLSPHAAGATSQATGRLIGHIVANIGLAIAGKKVRDVVNDVDPVVRRRT